MEFCAHSQIRRCISLFSVVHTGSGGERGKASAREITLTETVTSDCSVFGPTPGGSGSVVLSESNPRLQFPR